MSELHFAVHARLLTLHVRYIWSTTWQLDHGLRPFLTRMGLIQHRKEMFEGRPYLAPICHALEARPLPSGAEEVCGRTPT